MAERLAVDQVSQEEDGFDSLLSHIRSSLLHLASARSGITKKEHA
jgi:hypothetical protein